ncbi:MAG: endo-1,3-alpha-glucanase family glycosylhydrolase [Caldilineaceae bacterium]
MSSASLPTNPSSGVSAGASAAALGPLPGDTDADWSEKHLHLGWRIVLTLLLLLLVALFSILLQSGRTAKAAPVTQAISDPLVLAFYYSWYDDNTWNSGQVSDTPAERYVSADRSAMGRQIDQAKAAGIDGFVVAWYGPNGDTNQTEANLTALLEEAAARNFRIGILFETDSPFLGGYDSVAGALQHALSVHANQPAYLRADGKPVIFFWRSGMYDVGTWSAIRSQVDPGYGSLWIGEGVDTSQLSVFDGHYLYSNTWNPPADLTATNQKFASRVAAMREATGAPKLWVATVMPGYNDVAIRPNSGFARGRDGGAYYAQSWQAAIASSPNWVVITSFNEWPEGTYIEPSAAYGDAYIGLTAQYSNQFKAGGGAPLVAAEIPAESSAADTSTDTTATSATSEAPAVSAAIDPTTPTAFVTASILNLREGPGIGFASVGAVVEGDALPILGQTSLSTAGSTAERWWQVKSAAGPAWLFGDYVRAAGPLDGVPEVEATGTASPAATDTSQVATAVTTDTAEMTGTTGMTDTASQAESAGASPSFSIFSLRPARGSR